MAKQMPYFKFYHSEWTNGNITLESYEIQGLFINICSFYLSKEGDVTEELLRRRFVTEPENGIDLLLKTKNIKVKRGKISIKFLDEQIEEFNQKSKINTVNGSKGGTSRAKRTLSERQANAKRKRGNIEERRKEGEEEGEENLTPAPAGFFYDVLGETEENSPPVPRPPLSTASDEEKEAALLGEISLEEMAMAVHAPKELFSVFAKGWWGKKKAAKDTGYSVARMKTWIMADWENRPAKSGGKNTLSDRLSVAEELGINQNNGDDTSY